MKQLMILNGLMYLKEQAGGEISDIPLPLTKEMSIAVEKAWAEYDERGRPFLSYHRVDES